MEEQDQYVDRGAVAKKWLLPLLVMGLGVGALLGGVGWMGERAKADRLEESNKALHRNLADVQVQVEDVSRRLRAVDEELRVERTVAAAEAAAVAEPVEKPAVKRTAKPRVVKKEVPAQDPRVDKIQAKVEEQAVALAKAREDLDRSRQELEGRIGATREELNGSIQRSRDELGGSIARTHEEVVALQRRGEREYYEFDLVKSKQFQKVGPLGLSLKKASEKNRNFEIEMMVDDQKLKKKNVNLFEPILISTPDSPQAVQLVVNQVTKDHVRGYVSAPKYKEARPQLASTQQLQAR